MPSSLALGLEDEACTDVDAFVEKHFAIAKLLASSTSH